MIILQDSQFLYLQIVVASAVFLLSIHLFLTILNRDEKQLGLNSIKEALDKLTTGVVFADAQDEIFLTNLFARKHMLKHFNLYHRDMETLWQAVRSMEVNVSADEDSVITLEDGRYYYALLKNLGPDNGKQLTITDVTKEISLQNELICNQKILMQRNDKIREILLHLEDVKREQVTSYMHFRLHDILGQRLSMLERFLNNPDLITYDKLEPLVYNLTKDLREGFEREPKEILDDLQNSFKLLNVDLLVIGGLPEDKRIALLFVATMREAATNAVRHGHANTITATIYELMDNYCLDIKDNGIGAKEFVPGNGIKGMELRVRQTGGEIFFDTTNGFIIHVRVGGKHA
ncbi:MAG: hypothetical protein Q4D21_05110 [Phascolarctobacterium sp.]|nr:hypothetical protein [Phascolarctobacterium sp.]